MKNYYKTLGISQSSTKEEIKKAFRELALKFHPDKNTDQISAEKFKEINEAKQVLLNDLKKFQYDETLVDFLSLNTGIWRINNYKRKRVYRRNLLFALIKETVVNKFFVSVLFIITILLTIAFYNIPDEELSQDPPVIAKSVSHVEKEPLAEPKILVLYNPKKTLTASIKKNAIKRKRVFRPLYFSKKAVKKFRYNAEIKKERHVAAIRNSLSKKSAFITPVFVDEKINDEKILQKQLTNLEMIEILHQIKAEKQKLGSNSNCVQLIKSETSNISNVFMLANFLKGYGFVISGREKISATINGININMAEQCITISVGTL